MEVAMVGLMFLREEDIVPWVVEETAPLFLLVVETDIVHQPVG